MGQQWMEDYQLKRWAAYHSRTKSACLYLFLQFAILSLGLSFLQHIALRIVLYLEAVHPPWYWSVVCILYIFHLSEKILPSLLGRELQVSVHQSTRVFKESDVPRIL
jgi:hypothetical protein